MPCAYNWGEPEQVLSETVVVSPARLERSTDSVGNPSTAGLYAKSDKIVAQDAAWSFMVVDLLLVDVERCWQ